MLDTTSFTHEQRNRWQSLIVDGNGRIQYVGKGKNLAERRQDCIDELAACPPQYAKGWQITAILPLTGECA